MRKREAVVDAACAEAGMREQLCNGSQHLGWKTPSAEET